MYSYVKNKFGQIIDEWHVDCLDPPCPSSIELIDLVKSVLPKEDNVPIHIGTTGYVEVDEWPFPGEFTDRNYWTTDESGRFVFVLDNMLYFQRGMNRISFPYGSLVDNAHHCFSEYFTDEIREKVIARLNELKSQ